MADKLEVLLNAARKVQMTPEEQEEQRRSFAFGNAGIENDRITRQMINEQADLLKESNE